MPSDADPKPPEAGPTFIDFGCGAGTSMPYCSAITRGDGIGIDISDEAIQACRKAGYQAEIGNLLEYEGRNSAVATLAIDLLPEIGHRGDFERALSRLILAARNYTIVQHAYFDNDGMLAQQGFHVAAHFSRRVLFRPTVADYIHSVTRLSAPHAVVGLAMYVLGDALVTPLQFEQPGAAPAGGLIPPSPRSLRVVIGRKDLGRFRHGMRRGRAGEPIFLWERSVDEAG